MARILSLLLLASAAFAQNPQSRWSSVQLVPGLRDRLALRAPAAPPVKSIPSSHLIGAVEQPGPCSAPLLLMDIPKDIKFQIRHKKPKAHTLAAMPQAHVYKVCPDR